MPRGSDRRDGGGRKRKRPLVPRTRSAGDKPPEGVKDPPPDDRERKRPRKKRRPSR